MTDENQNWFQTTHWSLVLRARDQKSTQAPEALEQLCRIYWPPLYAYLLRQCHRVEDAQDLTQEFFLRLIERGWLAHLQHQDGKFRSFLLTFLEHFLSDQRDRAKAQKRGGGVTFISLEEMQSEERSAGAPADGLTPEQVFERRWVQALMDQATIRLREEYLAKGEIAIYDQLKDLQPNERGALTYVQLAAQWGMTEAAVKTAKHRMNRRHQQLLREVIAHTVTRPSEIEDEIRHFMRVLGG
jgi:RNA polymerase sigma-70 factor (ECF subfamily)